MESISFSFVTPVDLSWPYVTLFEYGFVIILWLRHHVIMIIISIIQWLMPTSRINWSDRHGGATGQSTINRNGVFPDPFCITTFGRIRVTMILSKRFGNTESLVNIVEGSTNSSLGLSYHVLIVHHCTDSSWEATLCSSRLSWSHLTFLWRG